MNPEKRPLIGHIEIKSHQAFGAPVLQTYFLRSATTQHDVLSLLVIVVFRAISQS